MMQKFKRIGSFLFCLVLMFSFTACAPSFKEPSAYKDLSDAYHAETDFPAMYNRTYGEFAITPYGDDYLFMAGSFLYVFDTESMIAVAACSKPECSHREKTCQAYFELESKGPLLQYYEGSVFLQTAEKDMNNPMRLDHWLYIVNPTQGTREKFCQLPYDQARYMIHRGYLYVLRTEIADNDSKNATDFSDQITIIERSPLKKELEFEKIYERPGGCLGSCGIIGDHLLYQAADARGFYPLELNLKTCEVKEITVPDGKEGSAQLITFFADDCCILNYASPERMKLETDELSFYSYNPASGLTQKIATIPDAASMKLGTEMFYDGTNLFKFQKNNSAFVDEDLDPNLQQTIIRVDEEMNAIDTIPIDFVYRMIINGNENFSFLTISEGVSYKVYAIDKRGEKMQGTMIADFENGLLW